MLKCLLCFIGEDLVAACGSVPKDDDGLVVLSPPSRKDTKWYKRKTATPCVPRCVHKMTSGGYQIRDLGL